MSLLKVTGGTPLSGSVRIGGAKNASFKLMIAALLGDQESRLLNFSQISDVELVAEIIQYLGADVSWAGERAILINPSAMSGHLIKAEHGAQGRFSTIFIPVMLHRFGQATVPKPGGDKIGKRPLERLFEGLEAMGARVRIENEQIKVIAPQLVGTTYKFAKNTHTGTETMIMAAVKAQGRTTLKNAALEPEVDDLISYLNQMGAKITRQPNRVIEIEGVANLTGAIHKIIPDRNEAVSYACAAIATRGDVVIENAQPQHLKAFLDKLEEAGGGYEVGEYGIRFYYQQPLRAVDVTTQIEPGFMTDWQPLWSTLMTQAAGRSTVHETVMFDRFQYTQELKEMGAQIKAFQPSVTDPDSTYNFNLEEERTDQPHAIAITGPTPLQSGHFTVKDLRHGATLVLAAMIAQGESSLYQVELIERGYEALDTRLRSLGASIKKIET